MFWHRGARAGKPGARPGGRLTTMLGQVDILSRTRIAGWAADPARPGQPVTIRVSVNGRRVRVVADRFREDLTAAFPGADGHHGFEVEAEFLPLSPFVRHDVEIAFAAGGRVLRGGAARIPALGSALDAREEGQRLPLVVTTTGRSGSSLLMARLAAHPAILVAREHPFELKLLTYHAHLLATLLAGADRERSTDPDTIGMPANRFFIGFNPFNDARDAADSAFAQYWETEAADVLRRASADLVDAYYTRVARSTGKEGARFFAEKIQSQNLTRQAVGFMFGGVHEILLVRDPRDIICSARDFWQRGFAEQLPAMKGMFSVMARPRQEPGLSQHVVRYEDLVMQADETMRGIHAFLGLPDDGPVMGAAESASFADHATSISPEATIGRWRRDLSAAEAAQATEALRPHLEAYGYSID